MASIKVSLEEMYSMDRESYSAFLSRLDQSLNPRSQDTLYDAFGSLGPSPESLVLDIGCRDAAQACELAERFGSRVIGVDLIDTNIQAAQVLISEKGLKDTVQAILGDIQHLDFEDETFDFIWCRDVLGHVPDLHQTFAECARVLKPNGKMLIFNVFATNLLTEEEADALFLPLATNPANMYRPYFEAALEDAGLSMIEADIVGSEWREYLEESDSKRTSLQLLRIARLRRNREQFIAEFGEENYACELANSHYGVYQMLGKLCAVIYTVVKPEASSG